MPPFIVFGFATVTFVPGLITFATNPRTSSFATGKSVPVEPPKYSPPINFQAT
jgi:hypothetical protein